MVPCEEPTRLYSILQTSINTSMKLLYDDPCIYSVHNSNLLPYNFKEEVIHMWKKHEPWKKYTVEYNQELLDYEKRLDPLYDFFVYNIENTLNVKVKEKRKYWLYISDENFTITQWHNHTKTADIVGVYYIEVNKNGPIEFEGKNKVITHYPVNNEMIVFSSNVVHRPIPSGTKNTIRISLNIEAYLQ